MTVQSMHGNIPEAEKAGRRTLPAHAGSRVVRPLALVDSCLFEAGIHHRHFCERPSLHVVGAE